MTRGKGVTLTKGRRPSQEKGKKGKRDLLCEEESDFFEKRKKSGHDGKSFKLRRKEEGVLFHTMAVLES